MAYPVTLEGFTMHPITIEPAGWIRGARVMVDGQPAPKGPKPRQVILCRDDGAQVIAQMQTGLLGFDPVPYLVIDNKPVYAVRPLQWYEGVWAALPLILLFIGGLIGGVTGALAFWINVHLFRSNQPAIVRYGSAALVSVGAAIIYFAAAIALNLAVGR